MHAQTMSAQAPSIAAQLKQEITSMHATITTMSVLSTYNPTKDMIILYWKINEARSRKQITQEEQDSLNSQLDELMLKC